MSMCHPGINTIQLTEEKLEQNCPDIKDNILHEYQNMIILQIRAIFIDQIFLLSFLLWKNHIFLMISSEILTRKKKVQQESKIFINYDFCVSKNCCENAFPECSIHSELGCIFWQGIWLHSTIQLVYKYITTCNTLFIYI